MKKRQACKILFSKRFKNQTWGALFDYPEQSARCLNLKQSTIKKAVKTVGFARFYQYYKGWNMPEKVIRSYSIFRLKEGL